MIPINIEIQGLYSYKEKQTIDFRQLTAAGLFGIFGAVGSGKSSILEAVLLALYGSTERLSDRGEKNSMVNLQSDLLLINFEFKAGKNNGHTYLARYAVKRNSKNFDELRTAEHTFYEKKGEQISPVSQKADEIVGMKKEHFKQTVIIPQGKFRDFIDLTPGPRAEMMKELFGLERFDLSAKTGSLLKSLKENKIRTETILAGLAEVTAEKLQGKEKDFKELAENLQKKEADFKSSEQKFQHQKSIQAKYRQLQEFKTEWRELEDKLPEIEKKKRIWKEIVKAKNHLQPVWNQLKDEEKELEKLRISIINCRRFKETYIQEIEQLTKEEADLKKTAEERPLREAKIRDLNKVIEIQPLLASRNTAEQNISTLKPAVDVQRDVQKRLQEEINGLEKQSDLLQLPDTSQLSELKSMLKEWDAADKRLERLLPEIDGLEGDVEKLNLEINQALQTIPSELQSYEDWENAQKTAIKKQEAALEAALQKQGLVSHTHLLQEGSPCPLCGSMEHPSPILTTSDDGEMEIVRTELVNQKHKLETIQRLNQTQNENYIRLEGLKNNLNHLKHEVHACQLHQKEIKSKLSEQEISSKSNLENFITITDEAVKKKENLLKTIKSLRTKYEEQLAVLESREKALRSSEQQLLELRSTILAKKEEIKDQEFIRPYLNKDHQTIQKVIDAVWKNIKENTNKLDSKQKVLVETRAKQSTNLANLDNYVDLELKTSRKIQELDQQFQELMTLHGFEHRDKLLSLFNHSLDTEKADTEIRQFEDRRLVVDSKIKYLKNEKGIEAFNQEEFDQLLSTLQELKSHLDKVKREHTITEQEISSLKSNLVTKKDHEKQLQQLENRETNLKELERLFKGSGFVKYVSTIYLKELCNTANLRFTKLTKNSLSLEIDEHNTFWVVDYLNGGKKRLLKTLSGGQTFQASLCLALALAEKVKSLNHADQSFFFLDEGFGALDRNSLRVVFETLKALRHENRIVGIISHVEELQQEIEVFAKIELDPETGSQVGYSFT